VTEFYSQFYVRRIKQKTFAKSKCKRTQNAFIRVCTRTNHNTWHMK